MNTQNIIMKNIENEYKELLSEILDRGVDKSDRTGPGTKSVFGRTIRHDMSLGFPILTGNKTVKAKVLKIKFQNLGENGAEAHFIWEPKSGCFLPHEPLDIGGEKMPWE